MGPAAISARATAVLALPLGLVAAAGAALVSASDERVIVNFFITLVLALSIQAFSGTSGIISFGHVAFLGVGAYVTALLTIPPALKVTEAPGLPSFLANADFALPLALVASLLVAGVVAGLLGVVFARMEADALSMATVSLLLIFLVLFQGAGDITGGTQGLYAIPASTTIWIAFAAALAAVFVGQLFARSKTGVQLAASRSDPLAAESLGVRLIRVRWVAWTLAGALIGFGGGLWASYNLAFAPPAFGFDLTFTLLGALVVGGLSSVTGGVVGVAVMTAVFELLQRFERIVELTGFTQIVLAVVVLLILYKRPNGLLGFAELPEALAARQVRLRRSQRLGPREEPGGSRQVSARPSPAPIPESRQDHEPAA